MLAEDIREERQLILALENVVATGIEDCKQAQARLVEQAAELRQRAAKLLTKAKAAEDESAEEEKRIALLQRYQRTSERQLAFLDEHERRCGVTTAGFA
jgi:hypothetical protein